MNCLPCVCYKVNYFTMYTEYSLYNDKLFAVSKIISTCIRHERTGWSSSIRYISKKNILIFRTTWEWDFFFLVAQSANFFIPEFNIRLYDKNFESDYCFFLHQNQNIFFSNIGNQNIFFRNISYAWASAGTLMSYACWNNFGHSKKFVIIQW
jgi:hypothetical protein